MRQTMFLDLQPGQLIEALDGRRWTPAQLWPEVARRVGALKRLGLQPGERVFLHFGNRLEFFAELLATWYCGACAIPLDARLTAFEVGKLIDAAQPRFRIVDEQTPADVLMASDGRDCLLTTEYAAGETDAGDGPPLARLDDPALMLFTSGSTGEPKGVLHTHRSLRARWITLRQSLGLAAYTRSLCLLPTHFGHGLICNCLFPWLSGCDLYITPPFRPDIVMRLGSLLDEHEISFMSSVPAVWNLALKASPPPKAGHLRRVHVGSAPLSAVAWQDIQQWCGTDEVFNAYGITETGSWVAGTTGGPVVPEDGLIGEPWGAVIRVLSARDTSRPLTPEMICAPGELGMIWLHTPALMQGYFQRPDLTAAVVQNGWFMTGDIGLLDDRGRLFIKGRERDEINKGGMKIYPADIDAVALAFAAVSDACCFGYPDEHYGENVALAVVLEDRSPETLAQLRQWVAERIAEHRQPLRWYLLDEIPRTSRGKINRGQVMQACLKREPLQFS
ncbi:MAG: long-chain fatty acid--CoA ligase [Gammaproteobacteria bacterium]|nr:MAG: long-chain fatty acid--CoA ligase [Gammaproteobacteria bacterium]